MGREIRRVPKGWEHPKNSEGKYLPLYRESFYEAFDEWMNGLQLWLKGKHDGYNPEYRTPDARGYSEYAGQSPDPDKYREQNWTEEEAICFQIYQTDSEGTPVSPVFETLQAMEMWLIEQGYSRKAAETFCKEGWAMSASFENGQWKEDIHTLD